MSERAFYYDLRHREGNRLIWRICNHRRQQPVSARCHVHTNPDNPDDEEDVLEFFEDSRKTDFTYAMHCVKNYYENKPQEWEAVQQ